MIETKVSNILINLDFFRQLSNQPLPVKTAFEIARLIRELDRENETFEKCRLEIIKKYASFDENNNIIYDEHNNILMSPEQTSACNEDLIQLMNNIVHINAEKIDISIIEDLQVTPAQILSLEPFINI